MGSRLTFVTTLPTWAVYALGFGTPLLTAGVAFLGNYFSHRAARDLEARSKREEVMRILRWAAELAVSNDAAKARLGIQELQALRDSNLLTPVEQAFIYAALDVTVEGPRQAITRAGEDAEAVKASPNVSEETLVPSEEEGLGEETDF
jgi:hypothetical protein